MGPYERCQAYLLPDSKTKAQNYKVTCPRVNPRAYTLNHSSSPSHCPHHPSLCSSSSASAMFAQDPSPITGCLTQDNFCFRQQNPTHTSLATKGIHWFIWLRNREEVDFRRGSIRALSPFLCDSLWDLLPPIELQPQAIFQQHPGSKVSCFSQGKW